MGVERRDKGSALFHIIHVLYNYCLYSIFQKLHFSKYPFSETPQAQYDHVNFLQSKRRKKCRKNLENRFNKIFMPKNILNRSYACAREVI